MELNSDKLFDFQEPDMFFYEKHYRLLAFQGIAGLDEVGRGPLAGPVTACALIIHDLEQLPEGINDSKKLSAKKRAELKEHLSKSSNICYAIASADAQEVDEHNILQATYIAMRRALKQLATQTNSLDFVLVDGNAVPKLGYKNQNLVKGDSRSISIAAASIMAKEWRDDYMKKLAVEYPGYGFEQHMGYGTKKHLLALDQLGPCPEHRRSFRPVREAELKSTQANTPKNKNLFD